MHKEFLTFPAEKLLEEFGGGGHKPGSGSAAAFQAMMSAQLIRTVIELTTHEKRKGAYKTSFKELGRIDTEINNRIYPSLYNLFNQDAIQFDKVIKLRVARENEESLFRKKELKIEHDIELRLATELPIEMAKLSIELAKFSNFVFDNGFRAVRGDSGVALSDAVAAIAGCMFIINLNLLSLGHDEWTEKIAKEMDALKAEYDILSLGAANRFQVLETEVRLNKEFHIEKEALRSDLWSNSTLNNVDIENLARRVQLTLWKFRHKIWINGKKEDPIELLQPDIVLEKILGYQFTQPETLGLNEINGELFEVAAIIDKRKKIVAVSQQFSPQTQNFTAAHELGHALMHRQVVQHRDRALDGSALGGSRDFMELQADKFATFFLMPERQIRAVFEILFKMNKFVINQNTVFALNAGGVTDFRNKCRDRRGLALIIATVEFFRDKSFMSMADQFSVSDTAMAIRLEELNLIEF